MYDPTAVTPPMSADLQELVGATAQAAPQLTLEAVIAMMPDAHEQARIMAELQKLSIEPKDVLVVEHDGRLEAMLPTGKIESVREAMDQALLEKIHMASVPGAEEIRLAKQQMLEAEYAESNRTHGPGHVRFEAKGAAAKRRGKRKSQRQARKRNR